MEPVASTGCVTDVLPDHPVETDGSADAHGSSARLVRALSTASVAAMLVCTMAFVALHLLPTSRSLDPVSVPLSSYALTPDAWLFDGGVMALIVGVVSLLTALVVAGELPGPSWPVVVTTGCCLALTVVIAFPDRTLPDGALTSGAQLHWVAAMTAFAGLPIAPLWLARRHRIRLGCSWLPRLAGWLAAGATVSFAALLGGSILRFAGQPNIWHVGGVLERALAGSETVAALILAVWLWRGCRCTRLR